MITRQFSILFILLFFLFCLSIQLNPALAQTKNRTTKGRLPVEANKTLQVKYGSNSWNRSEKEIDTAFVFLRDAKSGKVVKILLEETAPDSGIFNGVFSLSWGSADSIIPEIYIPPQNMRTEVPLKAFRTLLVKKKIKRKPLLFKRYKTGLQILEVFDSRSEVIAATQAYKKERAQTNEGPPIPSGSDLSLHSPKGVKTIARGSAIEAARLAERKAEMAAMALEASKKEADRIRKETLERQKRQAELDRIKKLALAEQKRIKESAAKLAALGLTQFNLNNFEKAEAYFSESIKLDPSNNTFYYQYGVALYKNGKYEEALIKFNISEVEDSLKIEKKYFVALTYYKLNELENALKNFRDVKASKHSLFSASAAFYEGLILYGQEEYELARSPFEYVLDNSKDPAMDNRAEEYIEKIARQLQFLKLQEKRNSLTVSLGAVYDSNILLISDETLDAGTSTDEKSPRALVSASYAYRFLFERSYTLSAKLDALYMYSTNADVAEGDPTLLTFSLPYTRTSTIGKRGWTLIISPGYERLDLNGENNQNSILFNIKNLFVMSENWYATYTLKLRQDDSVETASDSADETDALVYSVDTDQTYFLNNKKTKAIVGSFGYTVNAAEGSNEEYTRLDLGFSYLAPLNLWDLNYSANLAAYQSDYKIDRKDTNYSVNLSLSKTHKPWISSTYLINYTKNGSTDSDNEYTKYSITALLTFNGVF